MKLKYSQTQRIGTLDDSTLTIEVDYNPGTDEVDQIISVTAYNHTQRISTDLTAILSEQFGSPLDSMIESVNWREVYAEAMADLIEQE